MSSLDDFALIGVSTSLDKELFNKAWKQAVPYIKKSLKYSDSKYTLESIYQGVLENDLQLWVVLNKDNYVTGAVVTQIIHYPAESRLLIMLLGGKGFLKWQHVLDELRPWAKQFGCINFEIYGRPGWEKKAKYFNVEKIHTVFKGVL